MKNRFSLKIAMFALFIGVVIGTSPNAFSQATSGTILGQITDPQGAAVPQATVTVKSESTGREQTAVTNERGEFSIANLPPELYTITVTHDGFSTAVSSGNKLAIDQKMRSDIQLAVGVVSETVNIANEAPLLQTQTSETSQIVEQKSIASLPLLGRNFLDLTRLSAGVVSGQGGNTLNISVNGQREFGNSVSVDGIEVTSNRNNDTGLSPSVDSVQEFKIQTSAYAPEFGKAAGAVISIQTKSGSNQFHGSAYEFFRPTKTAAIPYGATAKPNLRQNNFGATIGGPIVKDKLFFFFSYEGVRSHDSFNYLDSVPPIGQIRVLPNGDVDLSGFLDPITGNQVPIFDPEYYAVNFVAQQFPGNIIPANRVSRAGLSTLLKLFPRPNQAGILNGYYSNFNVSQPYRYDSDRYESKVDYNISNNDRIAFTFHDTPYNYETGDRFGSAIPIPGGGSADSADLGDATNLTFAISETHVFSPNVINEFRFGYNRFSFSQNDLITDQTAATTLGFGNINLSNFPDTGGLPQVQLGTGYLTGGSTFKPLAFLDRNYQFSDNLSWQKGTHSLKFGGDFRLLNSRPTFSLFPTGYFFFNGAFSSLTSDPNFAFFDPNAFYGNGGSDIADLILGLPGFASIGLQLTDPQTKAHELSFYGQDSWQVSRKLVLNFGVRYEYQSPYSEQDNNLSNFDPATKQILLAGRGGNSETLINHDKNNFMPRLGFAYRLNDRTVLRAGYGIFYSPENDARSDVLTKNYPFATQQVYSDDLFSGLPFQYNLDTGIPRVTTVAIPSGASSINALTIPQSKNQTLFALDPNFETGYSQLYNITLQREIIQNFTISAGYVGSKSNKLPYAIGNINRNGRISNQLGQIQYQASLGTGDYNSLQITADKRFSGGSSFFVAYTWGKCTDNGPAPFNLGRNNQSPQNPFDLGAEHAVCGGDVAHNLVGTFVYELPFGRNRHYLSDASGVVDAFLGGWQLNGIANLRTGLPVNVIRSSADGTAFRPNLVGNPIPTDQTLQNYINASAFSTAGLGTTPATFIPGNLPRNYLRGPGYANLDMSIFKTFSLSRAREGMNIETRFEFFNITNTPHFANPNSVIGGGNFGKITGTINNSRIIQFAAKFNF